VPCPDGHACDGVIKITCEPATYCNNGTKHYCKAGKYGYTEGASTEASSCIICEKGTYQPGSGQRSCFECLVGFYNGEKGQTEKKDACLPCPKGSYCPNRGDQGHTKCPAGTYSDEEEASECTECALNTFNEKDGSKSADDCIPCSKNDKGQQQITQRKGETSPLACQDKTTICMKNGTVAGQEPINTGIKTECTDCPPGKRGKDGTQCIFCSLGRAQEKPGQKECDTCATEICTSTIGATSTLAQMIANSKSPFELIHPTQNDTIIEPTAPASKDAKQEKGVIDQQTSYILYALLASTVITIVLSHRFCPMKFKNLDFIFAGS